MTRPLWLTIVWLWYYLYQCPYLIGNLDIYDYDHSQCSIRADEAYGSILRWLTIYWPSLIMPEMQLFYSTVIEKAIVPMILFGWWLPAYLFDIPHWYSVILLTSVSIRDSVDNLKWYSILCVCCEMAGVWLLMAVMTTWYHYSHWPIYWLLWPFSWRDYWYPRIAMTAIRRDDTVTGNTYCINVSHYLSDYLFCVRYCNGEVVILTIVGCYCYYYLLTAVMASYL